MEKKTRLAAIGLAIAGLLLALGAGMAHAAQGSGAIAGCSSFPQLDVEKSALVSEPGRVATVRITVEGTQDAACGEQLYGLDFTNAYDGKEFALAIKGSQERNLFYLKPGQNKTFEGLVGIPPGTPARNYTLQVTAYPDSDHWKQESRTISLRVGQQDDSDAHWSTQLEVGWNLMPNAQDLGVYGCPGVNTGYRYSAYKGDYITLNRYGAVFSVAPFEPEIENERYGSLFVFSRERCTMESRVPAYLLKEAKVSLRDGQLLSVPPAWNGATVEALATACMQDSRNPADSVKMELWDASSQRWAEPSAGRKLKNGEAIKVLANFDCLLDLERGLGSQVG